MGEPLEKPSGSARGSAGNTPTEPQLKLVTDQALPWEKKTGGTDLATLANASEDFTSYAKADFGQRLAAAFLDNLFSTACAAIVVAVLTLTLGPSARKLSSVISLAVFYSYWIALQLQLGQTPGKKIMGIRVVKADGSAQLDTRTLLLREGLGKFLSVATLFAGYLMAFLRPDGRALHDLIGETMVVREKQ